MERTASTAATPGTECSSRTDLPVDAYAYVVGESALVRQSRRALHRAGIPKARITFSGYWKHKSDPALTC